MKNLVNGSKVLLAATTTIGLLAGCGGGNASGGGYSVAARGSTVGTSVPIGSLLEARDRAACALVGTGSVLVAGGKTTDREATDSAEMIEATGAVHPVLARMSTPRANARAIQLDGDLTLVIGGHDEMGQPLATSELYIRHEHRFIGGPDLQAPRDGSAIALVGSRIVIAGGKGQKSLEYIDTTTIVSHPIAGSLEREHVDAQMVALGGQVVIGGGEDTEAPEVFDVDAAKTVALGFMDGIRGDSLVVGPRGDDVIFVGGARAGSILQPVTKDLTTELRACNGIGTARVHGTAVSFGVAPVASGNGTLVLGGDDGTQLVRATDFVFAFDGWQTGPEMVTPRHRPQAVRLDDGRVIVASGATATGAPCGACEMILFPVNDRPTSSATFARYTDEELALASTLAELDAANRALQAAEAQIVTLQAQLASATVERDAALAHVNQLENELAAAKNELAATKVQLDQANARAAQLQSQLASAQSDAASLRAQLATANAQIANLQNAEGIAETRQRNAESALANANATNAQLQSQVASLQQQLATAQSQLQAARTQAAAAQTTVTTQTQPVPQPGVVPVVAAAPTVTVLAGLTPSTNPNRPVILAIDPVNVSYGQQVKVYVKNYSNVNTVYFGGRAAPQIGALSSELYNGVQTAYMVVSVPALPAGYTRVAVQWAASGLTSVPTYAGLIH